MMLVTSLVLGLALTAQNDDIDADADAAYRKVLRGELDEAEALYTSVLGRGADSADVWFNLGTVQLERDRNVEAVVSFEQALKIDPSHDEAQHNLGVARARLGAEPEDREPTLRDLLPGLARIGELAWGVMLVLGHGALVLGLALRRRPAAWAAIVVGGIGFAVSLSALGLLRWGRIEPRAIVSEATTLRGGPAERYPDLGTLPPGALIRPGEQREGYVEAQTVDGREGWLPTNRLINLD